MNAVYEAWRPVEEGLGIDEAVAERLARQAILDRDRPPYLGVLIDESVLYRPVGGPAVMRDQLEHLLDMSERPRISIQVVPTGVGANVGLRGAFVILSFPDDTRGMVFFENPDDGEASRDIKRLAKVAVTYDVLRDNALTVSDSRDFIRKVNDEVWTPQAAALGERAPIAAVAAAPSA
jgi:hypothetical protein